MIEAGEGVLETCGWCGGFIPEDTPVYACGIKVRDPAALAGKVGQLVPVALLQAERSLLAIVPTEDSEARKKGYDAVVMVCGKRCRNQLKKVASS
jgi:hypothetical protein